MPREQLAISGFTAGVISSPDSQDIPVDAAVFSLDIDPETGPGCLRGRFKDLASEESNKPVNLRSAALIEHDDGKVDVVYHDNDGSTPALTAITDFYSGHGDAGTLFAMEDAESTQMQSFGLNVRVGRSGGDVKWVGYIPDEQLGTAGDETTLYCVDAKLENPSGIPVFTKVVSMEDGSLIFGISHDDTVVHVIDGATGEKVDEIAGPPFVRVRGICLSEENSGGNKIWVYDYDGNNNGTLYSYSTSDYSLLDTINVLDHPGLTDDELPLETFGGNNYDVLPSDICAVSNGAGKDIIFIAYHLADFPGEFRVGQRLWVCYVDEADGATSEPVNATPNVHGGTADGSWCYIETDPGEAISAGTITEWTVSETWKRYDIVNQTYLNSLTRVSATEVLWVFRVPTVQYSKTAQMIPAYKYWSGPFYVTDSGSAANTATDGQCGITGLLISTSITADDEVAAVRVDTTPGPTEMYGVCYDETAGAYYLSYSEAGTIRTSEFGSSLSGGAAGDYDKPTGAELIDCGGRSFAVTTSYDDDADTFPDFWVFSAVDGYAGIFKRNVGYTYANQLSGAEAAMTSIYEGGSMWIEIANDGSTDGDFTADSRYYYKASYTYDGIQESAISAAAWTTVNGAADKSNKFVTVHLKYPGAISRRITHINIYRSKSSDSSFSPSSFFRLVKAIELKGEKWASDAGEYVHSFYDGTEDIGASYEARTGIPETIVDSFVDYEASSVCNGRLFVIRCRKDGIEDAAHIVYRSLPYRWDTFNWVDEYLKLPEVPTAIESFGGRVFVFSRTSCYKIDPETLSVDDVFPGCGALGDTSVCKTDDGIFFADSEGIYYTNGGGVEYIGAPIRDTYDSSGVCWRAAGHEVFLPILRYSSALKQVHCIADFDSTGSGLVYSFAFHVPTRRWDIWNLREQAAPAPSPAPGGKYIPIPVPDTQVGAFVGHYGELYFVTPSDSLTVAADETRRGWEWKSALLTMGTPSQMKRFYDVYAETHDPGTGGSLQIQTSVDQGGFSQQNNGASPATTRGKQIQVYLFGTGDDFIVRNLTILFRRMIGLR